MARLRRSEKQQAMEWPRCTADMAYTPGCHTAICPVCGGCVRAPRRQHRRLVAGAATTLLVLGLAANGSTPLGKGQAGDLEPFEGPVAGEQDQPLTAGSV